jgi:hypothetical protein
MRYGETLIYLFNDVKLEIIVTKEYENFSHCNAAFDNKLFYSVNN